MKAYLRSVLEASTPYSRQLLVREALQAEILVVLQRLGAMIPLAFHGGTALRFLYAIPRFSEDLDFALGRDLYDLLWYLSDPKWPAPNLVMLNRALEQSEWSGPELTPENWPEILEARLREIDWKPALSDVEPFLESTSEAQLLTVENLVKLVRQREWLPGRLN